MGRAARAALTLVAALFVTVSTRPAAAFPPGYSSQVFQIVLGVQTALLAAIVTGYKLINDKCDFGASSNNAWDFVGYDESGNLNYDSAASCPKAEMDVAVSLRSQPTGVVAVQDQSKIGWDALGLNNIPGCTELFDVQLSACIQRTFACISGVGHGYQLFCVSAGQSPSPPPWTWTANWQNSGTGQGYGWAHTDQW